MTLYSKEILRRSKEVRDSEKPSMVTNLLRQSNPICGDRVEWQLHIANQEIVEAWVEVKGCALCKASASVILDNLVGSSTEQLSSRTERFLTDVEGILNDDPRMGETFVFSALPTAPARRECVELPWHCLKEALRQN